MLVAITGEGFTMHNRSDVRWTWQSLDLDRGYQQAERDQRNEESNWSCRRQLPFCGMKQALPEEISPERFPEVLQSVATA